MKIWNSSVVAPNNFASAWTYVKIATISSDGDTGNGGALNIKGQIGGFLTGQIGNINAMISTRNGLKVSGSIYTNGTIGAVGTFNNFQVYKETNGTYSIYLLYNNYYKFDFTTSGQGLTVNLIDPSNNTPITPTGTLVVDSILTKLEYYFINGNVGIGNSAPQSQLHISSTIDRTNKSRGIRLDGTNNPDYRHWIYSNANDLIFDANGDTEIRQGWSENDRTGSGNISFQTAQGTKLGGSGLSSEKMRINANGNVGIGTSNPSAKLDVAGSLNINNSVNIRSSTFKVGGVTDKFYPVIFNDLSWDSGPFELQIMRSSVHMDGDWNGSMQFVLRGHNSQWGNGSESLDYFYRSSNAGAKVQNFVANAFAQPFTTQIIVFLRGGYTYNWRGTNGMTLENGNAAGTSILLPGGPADNPAARTFNIMTTIDPNFNMDNFNTRGVQRFNSSMQVSGQVDIDNGLTIRGVGGQPKLRLRNTNAEWDNFEVNVGGDYTLLSANGAENGMLFDVNSPAGNKRVMELKNSGNAQFNQNVNVAGNVDANVFINRGTDFYLGSNDGGADNKGGRGNFANGVSSGRALVKFYNQNPNGTRDPKLVINWAKDFPGGTNVMGPLQVNENIDVGGSVNLSGGNRVNFNWDTDYGWIGLKDNGANRKDMTVQYGDDDDDRLRFIHRHWSGADTEKMSMDRNNVYIPDGNVIVGKKDDWTPAIRVGSNEGKDTNIYTIGFGDAAGGTYTGMGVVPNNKKFHADTTGDILGTHIPDGRESTVFSNGWNPLFSVQARTGNVKNKGTLQTGNLKFTQGWSNFGNGTGQAEISNDVDGYKQLMIVGNGTAGQGRKVGVWDRLDVHGNLIVDGTSHTRYIDLGYGDPNREPNAGKIGYGQFEDGVLAIVGKGPNGQPRRVKVWDQLEVTGNVMQAGDNIHSGGNNWIFHSPDDGRRTMYIAPSKAYGNMDWNWGASTEFRADGIINNQQGIWTKGASDGSRGGTHFPWVDGNNYISGSTIIRGPLNQQDRVGLNDNQIRLRGIDDANHSLGFAADVDGPELKGCKGGKLTTNCGAATALKWDNAGNVQIGNKLKMNDNWAIKPDAQNGLCFTFNDANVFCVSKDATLYK